MGVLGGLENALESASARLEASFGDFGASLDGLWGLLAHLGAVLGLSLCRKAFHQKTTVAAE